MSRRLSRRDRDELSVAGCLAAGPAYVLDIARTLGISAGRVYVALYALEEAGLVVGQWDASETPRRRSYRWCAG